MRALNPATVAGEKNERRGGGQGRGRRISSLPTFGRGAAYHHPPGIHHPSASPKGR
jgi:hypothetical protein